MSWGREELLSHLGNILLLCDIRMEPTKSLAEVELEEGVCREDFALLDRYQSYSAELLRIALLTIAVCGFLLKEVYLAPSNCQLLEMLKAQRSTIMIGVYAIAISAALATGHRYFSSDSMACQIRYIRLSKLRNSTESGSKEWEKFNDAMACEKKRNGGRLAICKHCLRFSALTLIVGVLLLADTFRTSFFG